MGNKKKQNNQKNGDLQLKSNENWSSKRFFVGSFIIIIGFGCSAYTGLWKFHSLAGLGIMGMGILLTVLIGSGILSGTTPLDTGEVRRSITISIISVFFGFMTLNGTQNLSAFTSSNQFWWLLIALVGFYFAGRSAEEIVKNIAKRNKKDIGKV